MSGKKEKIIIGILAGILILASFALLAWYFVQKKNDISENFTTNDKEKESETTKEKVTIFAEPIIDIEIDDDGGGTATVYLDLDKSSTVVGAELYFKIGGTLKVTGIVCEAGFSCLDPKLDPSIVGIIALRPPSDDFGALSGRVAVAKILYNPSTSGSLTMNDDGIGKSIVSSTETEDNLITSAVQSFAIRGMD